jgi:hypothetical protein
VDQLLCILQDSKEDWLKESAEMGRVYKNAIITLNADAATDSSIGIIACSSQNRKSRRMKMLRAKCHSADQNLEGDIFFGISSDYGLSNYERGLLGLRGWTLQEEVLASRTLHFTDSLLVWRCVEELSLETLPKVNGVEDYHETGSGSFSLANSYFGVVQVAGKDKLSSKWPDRYRSELFKYWYYTVVNQYMNRQLTHTSDKVCITSFQIRKLIS